MLLYGIGVEYDTLFKIFKILFEKHHITKKSSSSQIYKILKENDIDIFWFDKGTYFIGYEFPNLDNTNNVYTFDKFSIILCKFAEKFKKNMTNVQANLHKIEICFPEDIKFVTLAEPYIAEFNDVYGNMESSL